MYVSVATMKVKSGKHPEARKMAKEMAEHINNDLNPEHPVHVLTPRFGKAHETIVLTQNFEDLSALDSFQRKVWSDENAKVMRAQQQEKQPPVLGATYLEFPTDQTGGDYGYIHTVDPHR